MKYASRSITGRREHNEDSFYVPSLEMTYPLVAVSDGMGGHAAGATASNLVIGGLFDELSGLRNVDLISQLSRAIQHVNMDVYRSAASDPSLRGMGATLVCALLSDKRFIAANIGDSRLYHFDGSVLTRITTDHSYVQMLVDAGAITEEEAFRHPQRNLITRAMGLTLRAEPDLFDCAWAAGDLLLLCSDGLCGTLDDDAITTLLTKPLPLTERCELLVEQAFDEGSSDNITVVLVCNEGGDCA